MANNTFEKNQKILYNSIPEQRLTYANQLTVKSWNDIVNILKTQANINADYLERLHKWLIGTGTGNVAIDGTKPFVEYILNDYVSLTENQEIEGDKVFSGHITAEDKATFNADTHFNGPTYINQIPEESNHATNKRYVDDALNDAIVTKADKEYVEYLENKIAFLEKITPKTSGVVVDDTLVLFNADVVDDTLYISKATVKNGILYI